MGTFSDDLVQRANFGPAVAEARSRAIGEAITYLRPLAEKGVRIIFEAPKPIFRAPAFRCSDWFNKSNRVCEAGTELPADLLRRYRQPTIEFDQCYYRHFAENRNLGSVPVALPRR